MEILTFSEAAGVIVLHCHWAGSWELDPNRLGAEHIAGGHYKDDEYIQVHRKWQTGSS